MSRKRNNVNSPCCIAGCTEPRYVQPSGKVCPRCWSHHQAWFNARNQRKQAGKPKRVIGPPRRPTVVINERLGIVQQIVGNLILSECELPTRGLHEATLLILQHRGWRIKYEFAIDETA